MLLIHKARLVLLRQNTVLPIVKYMLSDKEQLMQMNRNTANRVCQPRLPHPLPVFINLLPRLPQPIPVFINLLPVFINLLPRLPQPLPALINILPFFLSPSPSSSTSSLVFLSTPRLHQPRPRLPQPLPVFINLVPVFLSPSPSSSTSSLVLLVQCSGIVIDAVTSPLAISAAQLFWYEKHSIIFIMMHTK